MKRQIQLTSIIRHAILGSLLTALVFSLSLPPVSAMEFSADVPHPAVARIMSVETNAASFGSGTLVYKQGKHALLITNHHVIKDSKEDILVTFPNGFRSSAKVVASDPTWDLAALLIWSPSIKAVQITKQAPQPGDKLTIAGYGSGRYRAVSGTCSQYVSPGLSHPHEMVELKAVARQGDSGGPIFNQTGELAGVLFGAGWRTTAGSYSGRVKKFLDPLVGRMQKSVVEKQTTEVVKPEMKKRSPTIAESSPQATITGITVDESVVDGSIQGEHANKPDDGIQAIAAEDDLLPLSTTGQEEEKIAEVIASSVPRGTPLPKTKVDSATLKNVVGSPDQSSVEPDIGSELSEGEATLVDESYFQSKMQQQTAVTEVGSDQIEKQSLSVEVKPETTQTPQLPIAETIETETAGANESNAESVNPLLDLPESSSPVISTSEGNQSSSVESTIREPEADYTQELNLESHKPSDMVIGWEQLAGKTLLQQIRTILAGIGFLAIIVQLARR